MRSRRVAMIFVGASFALSGAASFSACGTPPAISSDSGSPDVAAERKVVPIVDAGDADAITGPMHLADTGLYSDFASRTLAAGIITYEPRYPLWADGAEKKRYLLLPPNTKIDTTSMDDWVFPIDTKVWKEFDVGNVVVETRLLWKVNDSQWWEVAYAWTADGTDAVAAPDGGVDAIGTTHDIPSQLDCNACHSNVRDVLIGVSALQLGASDGDGTLDRLVEAGLLTSAPSSSSFDAPGTGVTKDALGYLHGNCGHCHNASSAIDKQTQMRLRLSVIDTDPSQTQAYKTSLCRVMKHAVPPDNVVYALVPGAPDQSGIPVRMDQRGAFGMPPNCTKVVDDAGVATVSAWVASLDASASCVDAATD